MSRPIGFVTTSLVMLLLNFIAQPAYGAVRDYDVWLNPVTPHGGTLQPHLVYGRSCNGSPHSGCMEFEVDAIGTITFSVRNNWQAQTSLTCPATIPQGHRYRVITGIEVTTTASTTNPSEKGDFSGGINGTWLKMYAFPQADSQGYIYKVSDKNQGLSEVTVVNMNSHPASQGEKPFWYKITVEDCGSDATWETDPRGDNQGRT